MMIGAAVAVAVIATVWGAARVLGPTDRAPTSGAEKSPVDVPTMNQEILQLDGQQSPVNDMTYLSGDRAVTVDSAGTLSIWDTTTGRPLAKHVVTPNARLLSVAVSPDGSRALIGRTKSALVYDLKTGTVTVQLPHPDEVWAVAYASGGTAALTACLDGTARLWDLASGQVTRTFSCGKQAVWTVALSADGRWVATGGGGALRAQSWDYAVRIWDAGTGREVHELTGHTGDVRQLVFMPDSTTVVSGGFDGGVRVWDAVAGKERRTIQAHTAFVERVAALPDGRRVLSVGSGQLQQDDHQVVTSDVAVRMWDIETGRPLAQWTGHRRGVRTLAVSPDGKQFLTGSDDRTVRLWGMP
jgi:WD40 repeat protein